MNHLAIIPARSGSKGLKDKNIKALNGIPLLAYSIEAALKSGMFFRKRKEVVTALNVSGAPCARSAFPACPGSGVVVTKTRWSMEVVKLMYPCLIWAGEGGTAAVCVG